MRGEPRVSYQYFDRVPPAINDGQTVQFTDANSKGLCRKSFERPRPMMVYVFWDPYKNNPGPLAQASTRTTPAGTAIEVLGRLKIGNQGTLIEFNFDVPWGQLIVIPVTAEQVEVSAMLISPVPPADAGGYQAFNDPPALVVPVGSTLPNPSIQLPTGFVNVTGAIGTGNAGPTSAAPPTRSINIPSIPALTTQFVAIAYGARRVTVLGNDAANTLVQMGNGPVTIPLNTKVPLLIDAPQLAITNTGAAPSQGYQVIYELGI